MNKIINQMQKATNYGKLKILQQMLRSHPIYQSIKTEKAMKTFMECHVFAVWDFMSLLKTLQRRLTCVQKIWTPAACTNTAGFINEIVLGEETDIHPDGKNHISHYELYLQYMEYIGANTKTIRQFVYNIASKKQKAEEALKNDQIPQFVQHFVMNTLSSLDRPTSYIASQFFYGRETQFLRCFKNLCKIYQKIKMQFY